MRHKRIIVIHYGGPDALQVLEEDCPEPKAGDVRVKVLAAGVSLPDILAREGVHPETPQLPFTPGWDLIGVVDQLGDGVSGIEPGRIVAAMPISGAYAEFVCLPKRELVPVPLGLDPAEAVSLILNYITAYQMLHRSAHVKSGQRALVHGAAGGVGTALLQLGRLVGLEMFGTCSSRGASAVSDLGGIPIDYKNQDFVKEIHRLASPGVDVVFDGIGGSNLWRSREALRPGGKIVVYGFTSKLRGGRLASGRSGGRHRFRELARSHLVPLGTQPPAAATRALSYFEEGNTTLAREAALSGLVEEYSGQSFHHSKGDPRAICMAVVGFADLAEGQHDAALAWADRAIATDSRCPIGWLAKARVLLSQDRVDDAFSAAADGMRHQPGDPDLYEWYQELRLQRGQRASAAAVQEEMRNALLSRNKETLLYRYDP